MADYQTLSMRYLRAAEALDKEAPLAHSEMQLLERAKNHLEGIVYAGGFINGSLTRKEPEKFNRISQTTVRDWKILQAHHSEIGLKEDPTEQLRQHLSSLEDRLAGKEKSYRKATDFFTSLGELYLDLGRKPGPCGV